MGSNPRIEEHASRTICSHDEGWPELQIRRNGRAVDAEGRLDCPVAYLTTQDGVFTLCFGPGDHTITRYTITRTQLAAIVRDAMPALLQQV